MGEARHVGRETARPARPLRATPTVGVARPRPGPAGRGRPTGGLASVVAGHAPELGVAFPVADDGTGPPAATGAGLVSGLAAGVTGAAAVWAVDGPFDAASRPCPLS